jgi:hypothetical protein
MSSGLWGLEGLENLTELGLLSGLEGIATVTGDLKISYNSALTSLSGLSSRP